MMRARTLLESAWSRQLLLLAAALAITAALVALAGRSPLAAGQALWNGAFGSAWAFSNLWTKTIPLLVTGLAITVAFRAGFWNIGAEGQFMAGAIVAGSVGTWSHWPTIIHLPLVLVLAALAGAMLAWIPAWLRVSRGALEVISTIMLNFVMLYVLSWLVHGPLQETSGAQPIGNPVASSVALPRLFGGGTTLHAGLAIALSLVLFAHVLLERTETGFRIRMVGASPRACEWAGVPVARTVMRAAAISGGLAGLAGAIEVLGVLGRLFDKVSPGYGFTAIAVALLARLRPLALIPAALLFGALEAGGSRLQQDADVSQVLVLVIQGIVILATLVVGLAARGRE